MRSLIFLAALPAAFALLATPAGLAQAPEGREGHARELLGREDFARAQGRDRVYQDRGREHRERIVGREQDWDRPPPRREPGYDGHGGRDGRDPGWDRPVDRPVIPRDRPEDRRDHRWETGSDRDHGRYEHRRDRRDYRHVRHNDRYYDRRYRDYDRYDRRYRHYDQYDRYNHRRYVGPRHHRSDWRYHRRYYDRYASTNFHYYDRFCRSSGDELIVGALLGALIGSAASDGDGGAILAGGLIGGGIGASLNSCDRSQYHYATHYAFSHNRPAYWHNPHSGVYGVIYARDYYSRGQRRCRWGDAEIYMPNGEVVYDRVRMCLNRYGYWEVARRQ